MIHSLHVQVTSFKDLIESTNDDFLREMDRYIESHRYFSMYLWLDKKMHPLELDVEHVL